MREQYRTVAQQARIELDERKSRFIAVCRPLENEQAAQAFVDSLKQEFPDASHHVYAWILGGERILQRYSDDGEPQGTAGLPVLDALRRQGIDQAGIVVVRYFGGTLLGTGGLSRAYSRAAAQAVEAALPVVYRLCRQFRVTAGYAGQELLSRAWRQKCYETSHISYGIDVETLIAVPQSECADFDRLCADLTQGAALIEPQGLVYRPLPPPDPPPVSSV
ncbi:MAG: YigZ family protein [Clostridiaceae bacterium]|nr:YigZ family protein [Clostridiaceae bacterium]